MLCLQCKLKQPKWLLEFLSFFFLNFFYLLIYLFFIAFILILVSLFFLFVEYLCFLRIFEMDFSIGF